jgi:3-deoxy-manno-octulosonate cytidylyltransferase (CMP-KDO synthetase)
MSFKVVIPARFASTRLPGKPLLEIHGKPMVQWVIDAACQSHADEVLVATDDPRIASAVKNPRGTESMAMLTGSEHRSGTDRIAEVALRCNWTADTVVVNVQGDEPQMPPQLINQVAQLLLSNPQAHMSTLATPIKSLEEFLNPNVVKVVSAASGMALYFSRAPIPWHRDGAPCGISSQTQFDGSQRHLGIYAYRVEALLRLTQLPASQLELAESLEQLRAMQSGMQIAIATAVAQPGMGVDTPQDIERIRREFT